MATQRLLSATAQRTHTASAREPHSDPPSLRDRLPAPVDATRTARIQLLRSYHPCAGSPAISNRSW